MTEPQISSDIEEARAMRAEARDGVVRAETVRERELKPLWNRIDLRTVHNGFGEEFDLTLQIRRKTA